MGACQSVSTPISEVILSRLMTSLMITVLAAVTTIVIGAAVTIQLEDIQLQIEVSSSSSLPLPPSLLRSGDVFV